MLKLFKLFLVITLGIAGFQANSYADSDKGLKLFRQELRTSCGFSGNVMAKKHTQAEWKSIYEAGKLSDTLREECPKLKPIKENLLVDVYDFLYDYASDSGNTAMCN